MQASTRSWWRCWGSTRHCLSPTPAAPAPWFAAHLHLLRALACLQRQHKAPHPAAGPPTHRTYLGLSLMLVKCNAYLYVGMLQEDLEWVDEAGRGRVDITVGSALDIFGGQLPYEEVVAWHRRNQS